MLSVAARPVGEGVALRWQDPAVWAVGIRHCVHVVGVLDLWCEVGELGDERVDRSFVFEGRRVEMQR